MPSLLTMPRLREAAPAPAMLTKTYTASSVTECLLLAKRELGPSALILNKRTYKKGAWFGLWGGREMTEVTFGVVDDTPRPAARRTEAQDEPPKASDTAHVKELEARIAELTGSIQEMRDAQKKKPAAAFTASPVEAVNAALNGRGKAKAEAEDAYPILMRQLVDSEIAEPLARLLIQSLPPGLSHGEAQNQLRTALSQRLKVAVRPQIQANKMLLLAFIGTTGVGKTTTIAKLAAQYALVDRRRIGIVTLDTARIAAAQQLVSFGEIMRVPVRIAHDKAELIEHLSEFAAEKMECVLLDTAGRSPNDMIPLGETAHYFEGMGAIHKFLAVPATLSARDMENTVSRFNTVLKPDALVLTKLDETSDNTCFGKLLTVQAKTGLPLAYVTTGQKVPDDIAFPDAHAIAARILSTSVL